MDERKHSGFGIASCACGLGGSLLPLLALRGKAVTGVVNPELAVVIAAGLLLFAALLCGIAGIVQKERRRVSAVIGTVFSTVCLLGAVLFAMMNKPLSDGTSPRFPAGERSHRPTPSRAATSDDVTLVAHA